MNRVMVSFLVIICQALALALALLGYKTLPANPLGWFLLLVGVSYIAGIAIVFFLRRERFWESPVNGLVTREEVGDRSFWLISAGMVAAFFCPPLEYLYFPSLWTGSSWMPASGVGLVVLGVGLFLWARRTLNKYYSGHLSIKTGQVLVQTGPYRLIRHPAYAGYFLMGLGISLGYSSLVGLISNLALLLPSITYRMRVEDKLLEQCFGETFQQYKSQVKRFFPGVW